MWQEVAVLLTTFLPRPIKHRGGKLEEINLQMNLAIHLLRRHNSISCKNSVAEN